MITADLDVFLSKLRSYILTQPGLDTAEGLAKMYKNLTAAVDYTSSELAVETKGSSDQADSLGLDLSHETASLD